MTRLAIPIAKQALRSGKTPAGLEGALQGGHCLLSLNRPEEAAQAFERVAAEGRTEELGPRWPVLATCQLWLLRLRQDRFADADAIFEACRTAIVSRSWQPSCRTTSVPSILLAYRQASESLNVLKFNPDRVRYLERAVAVERFLKSPAR